MINFILNNETVHCDLPEGTALVDFLRDKKRLTGIKIGCREGDCGACTVLVGEMIDDRILYLPMTSCLMPIGNVKNKHIVTIEGINLKNENPIQQAFIDEGATQCGFCTPGLMTSLIAFIISDKEPTLKNAIESIAGNICRCTGYKAIERAVVRILEEIKSRPQNDRIKWAIKNNYIPDMFLNVSDKLKTLSNDKNKSGNYIVGGGTDVLIQDDQTVKTSKLFLTRENEKLRKIKCESGKCYIGSACTVTEIRNSEMIEKMFPEIKNYLKLMASEQIRNMATVGGNIANGSPIGDLAILLMALDSTLIIKSINGKKRETKLKTFFKGYKKVDLQAEDLIESIYFDIPNEQTKLHFEKISKRTHLDMATVNSAMSIVLTDGIIKSAHFAVGGLGSTIRDMKDTTDFLIGKKIENDTFRKANEIAQGEITPRSRPVYKRLLVKQMLFLHLSTFNPESISLEALK